MGYVLVAYALQAVSGSHGLAMVYGSAKRFAALLPLPL
jgi:hypothetical protein